MLTKEEEAIVEGLVAYLSVPNHREKLKGERIEWLVKKLKEVNEECSKLTEELKFSGVLEERLTSQLRIQEAEISNLKVKLSKKNGKV